MAKSVGEERPPVHRPVEGVTLYEGDAVDVLKGVAVGSVQTTITSPPFFNLRRRAATELSKDIGSLGTFDAWLRATLAVFDEVHRVLRPDGTLWVEMGDCYLRNKTSANGYELRPKQLLGQPWRLAFALQERGWLLRAECVFWRPNAMPEAPKDRPGRDHSTVFLFSKGPRYKYRRDAVKEPVSPNTHGRGKGVHRGKVAPEGEGNRANASFKAATAGHVDTRNLRTVWRIPLENASRVPGFHDATFPPALPAQCIRASTDPGDLVLDPFAGSGTTGLVAAALGRRALLVELYPAHAALIAARLRDEPLDPRRLANDPRQGELNLPKP